MREVVILRFFQMDPSGPTVAADIFAPASSMETLYESCDETPLHVVTGTVMLTVELFSITLSFFIQIILGVGTNSVAHTSAFNV